MARSVLVCASLFSPLVYVGTTSVLVQKEIYRYNGEIDEEGKACGSGIANKKSGSNYTLSGTWMDGELHGVCEYLF